MPAAWSEILDALEFLSMTSEFDNAAWVDRETGAVHTRMEHDDDAEALPEDIDDARRYVALPTPRDLDLGRPLVNALRRRAAG
jgi:hypothetical protein